MRREKTDWRDMRAIVADPSWSFFASEPAVAGTAAMSPRVSLFAMAVRSPIVVRVVYLALSRSGPLGPLGLLVTPGAMIIASAVLVAAPVAALTPQIVDGAAGEPGAARVRAGGRVVARGLVDPNHKIPARMMARAHLTGELPWMFVAGVS